MRATNAGPARWIGGMAEVVLATWCCLSCAGQHLSTAAFSPPPASEPATLPVVRSCPGDFPTLHGTEALVVLSPQGEINEIPHTRGRYKLLVLDDEHLEPPHQVFLNDTGTGKLVRLYGYGRHASFLWGPGTPALAINDHGGSDYSTVVVFLFQPHVRCIDVLWEVSQRKLQRRSSIFGNHHVFFEAMKWLGEDQLLLRVTGYGDVDPNGFELCLMYGLPDCFVETACGSESEQR